MGQLHGHTCQWCQVVSKLDGTRLKLMKHYQPVQDKNRRNQVALRSQLSQRIVCPLAATAIRLQIDRVHLREKAQHISGIHCHAPPISIKNLNPIKMFATYNHSCPVLRSISYPHPSRYLLWWGFSRNRERYSSFLSWMMLDASGQNKKLGNLRLGMWVQADWMESEPNEKKKLVKNLRTRYC